MLPRGLMLPPVCVPFAMLKPCNNSQRPFKLVAVRIGPPGGQLPADGDGLLDRGQRLLRRPSPASRIARLFSDPARSGRNASGRAAASSRRMAAASSARGQRLLPPPQLGQPDRQVVQRRGQVGPERVRAGRGQLPADGDGFLGSRPAPPPAAPARPAGPTGCSATLARSGRNASGRAAASSRRMAAASSDRGQRLLPPPQVGQPDRQVVQRPGQVGPERVRAGRGQLPVDGGGFLGSRPAPPPAAPARPAGPTGCSATLARSGRNASGRAAASSRRMATASSARGQRLLPPPQVGQPDRQVVQRPGQAVGGVRFSADGRLPGTG